MPGTAARTLACAADLFARVRKLRYDGIAIASRIPRMMITTRSSISVKPRSSVLIRCHRLDMSLLRLVTAVAPRTSVSDGSRPYPQTGEDHEKGAVSRAHSAELSGALSSSRPA